MRIEARVLGAGLASYPNDNKQRMRIAVDHPYPMQGQPPRPYTFIWGPASMPEPQPDEMIAFGHNYIEFRGVRYDKPENDTDPWAPLR